MLCTCKIECKYDGRVYLQVITITDDICTYRDGECYISTKKIIKKYFGKDYKIVDLWLH